MCKYCEEKIYELDGGYDVQFISMPPIYNPALEIRGVHLSISGNDWLLENDGLGSPTTVRINYCPNCGRKLTK